jgi:glycosyltransferase involved in cell wall biosynthesis
MQPLTLIIPTIIYGGAERVMVNMANWWASRGRPITLITYDANDPAYPLHRHIKRLSLDTVAARAGMSLTSEENRIACIRLALQAAGHKNIISFLSRMNIRTLLAARGLRKRVMVSERVYPPAVYLGAEDEARRRECYPEAAWVVVQTRYAQTHWADKFLPPDKIKVIANPVSIVNTDEAGPAQFSFPPCPYILAAGRLDRQKGFDLLISAFAKIGAGYPGVKLIIAGEGPEREILERQIADQRLSGTVQLPGAAAQIHQLMSGALCFALSSRFEGMPNALMEAMAWGLPCIAFDCPTGPAELIRSQQNGLLAAREDVGALAQGLGRLLDDEQLRCGLGRQAKQDMQAFAPEKIMPLWEELLAES